MARLDVREMVRLVGFVLCGENTALENAYGVRELVCCQLSNDTTRSDCHWLLGVNLDTGVWEAVHDDKGLPASETMELRPDVFLSP